MLHNDRNAKKELLLFIQNNQFVDVQTLIKKHSNYNKTTVYRNLKKLENDGLIKNVFIKSKSYYIKSDLRSREVVFICKKCKNITSLSIDRRYINELPPIGSKLEEFEINLYGVCNSCNF